MKHGTKTVLLCPDAATSSHMADALVTAGIEPTLVCSGGKGWPASARRGVSGDAGTLLIVSPSPKLGRALLEIIREVVDAGGIALAWALPAKDDDARLLHRLLEQAGCALCASVPTIACAAALLRGPEAASGFRAVRIKGRRSQITERIEDLLSAHAVPSAGRGDRTHILIEMEDGGAVRVSCGKASCVPPSLEAAAGAIALVSSRTSSASDDGAEPVPASVEIDEDMVSLIARPPRRLLSEVASKRLCAAFGFEMVPERLCASPTDAVRFSSDAGGRIVLKLVRPALEGKLVRGAVYTDLDGPAEIKRAYHSLETLGAELSPPKPLGVLAAVHASGGRRLWLRMGESPSFGRYLEGGLGDSPSSPPDFALILPVHATDAIRALRRILVDQPEHLAQAAEAVERFAWMLHRLDGAIDRAEIHPLALGGSPSGTFVLDAIFGISDDAN